MLNDSIDGLANATMLVTRRAAGATVNGIYVKGAATTFSVDVVLQPAFNLNRVVGGANLEARVDNQKVTDVRVFYSQIALVERTLTTDPDVVTYNGADWTVARVETWDLSGETHYRVIISKQTHGGAV